MCLGIPGKIIDIYQANSLRMGKVDFGGVVREVCIEALPEAKTGDFTIVHAGFALNILSEEEARETLEILSQLSMVEDELGGQEQEN
ncbi:MAG: HypC/HybG/HupF family hydrogenase formation chaperone [Anaerolineaceae bacterium]|nr:HypC/HybG/HupF family hydrogenase formation chaperone [Anaerolineaceae bacterium]